MPFDIAIALLGITIFQVRYYILYSSYVDANVLSKPTIIQYAGTLHEGNRFIADDFREAYYWLNQNTAEDDVVMSWWDYGYQLAGMSNRTTIVDNNTWNFTHIGTVGKIFASDEDTAYKMC